LQHDMELDEFSEVAERVRNWRNAAHAGMAAGDVEDTLTFPIGQLRSISTSIDVWPIFQPRSRDRARRSTPPPDRSAAREAGRNDDADADAMLGTKRS
jgi:hypothetical protein